MKKRCVGANSLIAPAARFEAGARNLFPSARGEMRRGGGAGRQVRYGGIERKSERQLRGQRPDGKQQAGAVCPRRRLLQNQAAYRTIPRRPSIWIGEPEKDAAIGLINRHNHLVRHIRTGNQGPVRPQAHRQGIGLHLQQPAQIK